MFFRTWTWMILVTKKIAVWLSILSMFALVIVMLINISGRYLFNIPVPWANELTLYLFAWVTFMGASLGVEKNNMASVTIILDRFKGLTLKIINFIIQLFVLAFSVLFLFLTYNLFTSPTTYNTVSPSLSLPMWIPYLILPLGFLFILIFCINNIINVFRDEQNQVS